MKRTTKKRPQGKSAQAASAQKKSAQGKTSQVKSERAPWEDYAPPPPPPPSSDDAPWTSYAPPAPVAESGLAAINRLAEAMEVPPREASAAASGSPATAEAATVQPETAKKAASSNIAAKTESARGAKTSADPVASKAATEAPPAERAITKPPARPAKAFASAAPTAPPPDAPSFVADRTIERPTWADLRVRTRAWMTDRRGIALSLVPLVVLAGFAGTAVVIAAMDPAGTSAGVAAGTDAADARAAQAWLIQNVDADRPVLVDAALAPGLVQAGWAEGTVLTAGSGGEASWRDVAYVATSAEGGTDISTSAAWTNSVPVASFGDFDIRRVTPEGATLAAASAAVATETRTTFGAELVRNPQIVLSDPDRATFSAGNVDARISVILATLAANGSVTVAALPVVPGEEGGVIRQVALGAVSDVRLVADGAPTPAALAIFDGLTGDYAPTEIVAEADTLMLRFAPATGIPSE